MSTSTEELRVRLLDAKKAETELRSVRRELERTTGATSESGNSSKKAAEEHSKFHRALGGIGNAFMYGGGLLGITAVGYGLKDVVQGGIKAQETQMLLKEALRETGQAGSKHMGELQGAIASTSTTGGFGALEETEGLTQLVRETKSSTAAIRDNREAITLARGAHEGYSSALSQVERMQTGQVGRLQKLIGILQPVKYYMDQLTATEKKAYPQKVKEAELKDKEATALEANQRVVERYGGAVVSYNKSAAGSITNANNAFKLATESLGEKLLPAVTDVAKGFGELVTEMMKGEGIWGTVGRDATKLWEALKGTWEYFEKNHTALKGLEVGLGALGAAWGTEKVIGFVNALKGLAIAQGISRALGVGGLATAEAEAGGVAEAAAPELAGLVAALTAAPAVIAAAAATMYGKAVYKERNNLAANAEGAFAMLHGGNLSPQNPILAPLHSLVTGQQRLGGTPLYGNKSPAEAALVNSILEPGGTSRLTPHTVLSPGDVKALEQAIERGLASHKADIYMDSKHVAEALFANPYARRLGAEGALKHTLGKKALE